MASRRVHRAALHLLSFYVRFDTRYPSFCSCSFDCHYTHRPTPSIRSFVTTSPRRRVLRSVLSLDSVFRRARLARTLLATQPSRTYTGSVIPPRSLMLVYTIIFLAFSFSLSVVHVVVVDVSLAAGRLAVGMYCIALCGLCLIVRGVCVLFAFVVARLLLGQVVCRGLSMSSPLLSCITGIKAIAREVR